MQLGTVVHEMLHAAGFWHEQSRPDRNEYVQVNWDNISPGREDNFARYSRAEVTTLSLGYDIESVMHYSAYAFSKNRRPTIQTLFPSNIKNIGQRSGMSKLDIQKLNKLYQCEDKTTTQEVKCVDVYTNGMYLFKNICVLPATQYYNWYIIISNLH